MNRTFNIQHSTLNFERGDRHRPERRESGVEVWVLNVWLSPFQVRRPDALLNLRLGGHR